MRKTGTLIALCALFGLVVFASSCRRSTPKSRTELISRTWLVQKAEANPGGVQYEQGGTNNSSNYQPYRLSFNASGFTLTDQQNVSTSGTWAFGQNETVVQFTVPTNPNFRPAQMAIVDLNEGTLVVRFTQVNNKGQSSEITLTLVPAG